MRRIVLLALILLCATSVEAQRVFRGRIARTDAAPVQPNPSCVIDTPTSAATYSTSTSAITIGGVCEDEDGTISSVTVSCATCTPTSVSATLANPNTATTRFTAAFTAQTEGANTLSAQATDNAANTSTAVSLVSTYTASDSSGPSCTITTNSGSNFSTGTTPTTINADCSDNVAVTSVTYTNNGGASQSCSGLTSAACSVSLVTGANVIVVTPADQAGNTPTTDSITVTLTVTLAITTTSMPPGEVNSAYSRTLAATGGSTPYTWDNNSGGTSLGGGACTGLSISTAGVVSGTPTTNGTCNFTAKVTDNAAATDTQALSIAVAAEGAGESAHDYFDTLKALPEVMAISACSSTVPGDNGACSLRNSDQIEAVVATSPSTVFSYQFGTDTYTDARDGTKVTIPQDSPDKGGSQNSPQFAFAAPLEDGTLTVIWDAWFGPEFLRTECGGENSVARYKTFMLRGGASGVGAIYFETRNNWGDTGTGSALSTCDEVSIVDNRIYPWEGGDGAPAGLTSDAPPNLSGDGAISPGTFASKVSTWTRYILHVKTHVAHDNALFDPWESHAGVTLSASPDTDGDGTWNAFYLWVCDETRDCQPLIYGLPWKNENMGNTSPRHLTSFLFQFDSSTNTRVGGEMIGYLRNLVFLRNYSLSLDMSDTTIFKKPVP